MIYLKLFLTFLKIGAVSFGGGYAMIPLIQQSVLDNSWLTEDEFLNFLAISETTPGPIAINMATFIGSSQGGVLGSILATIGVVLPAFLIILLISIFLKKLLKYTVVSSFLDGVKPVIVSLVLTSAITIGMSVLFGLKSIGSFAGIDYFGIIIFGIIAIISTIYFVLRKKALSPISIILFSGILGILFYGL